VSPAGPGGALFPAGFFELERAELTAFVPVNDVPPAAGRVRPLTIPGVEAAVMLHCGPIGDLDQTYGHLGTVVAERAIGVDGPIREYYLSPLTEPTPAEDQRTEICWPVFHTAAP
jgi:effector-binding domain-containing protein